MKCSAEKGEETILQLKLQLLQLQLQLPLQLQECKDRGRNGGGDNNSKVSVSVAVSVSALPLHPSQRASQRLDRPSYSLLPNLNAEIRKASKRGREVEQCDYNSV